MAAEAVRIARASATALRTPVVLDDRPPAYGRFETPVEEDPFELPLERKIADILAADRAMNEVKGIAWTESLYSAQREWKTFAATDGSYTDQVITHVGAGLEANAIDGDEHQRRSYPDNGGRWASAGYEFMRGDGPAGQRGARRQRGGRAPRGAAAARGHAHDPAPPEPAVHADPRELRPSERAGPRLRLGGVVRRHELPTPDMLGSFRYGSDLCDIVADATVPGGLGTFGWDDEGVAAQQVPIVKEGMFVGYLSSRETGPRIGRQSGGAMRADGWNRIPLIRMTNVNLLPKPGMSFEDIVADTDDGLLFETNRSWSIDDRRLNFQFSTEVCREIKGGKAGQAVPQRHLHGHHLRAVAVDGRRRRRLVVGDVEHAELRQGRARPGGPRRARRVGRAVPQRAGGGGRMSTCAPPAASAASATTQRRRSGSREEVVRQAEATGAGEAEALVVGRRPRR